MPKIYIPVVFSSRPGILGVETTNPVKQMPLVKSYGARWVRWNGVRWPDEINYAALQHINASGLNSIVVMQTTGFIPNSVQTVGFSKTLAELAKSYPNVNYWEIWNEPDIPPLYSSYFLGGGWEGAAYGRFLKVVKEGNPGLKLLFGGLAGDMNFLEKALAVGPNFDGLSFHAYQWFPNLSASAVEEMVQGVSKATNKPLFLTETSLLARDEWQKVGFDHMKAEYLRLLYPKARELRLNSCIWFTVGGNGWMNSDLTGESIDVFKELSLEDQKVF
jgi:hypothetical protein